MKFQPHPPHKLIVLLMTLLVAVISALSLVACADSAASTVVAPEPPEAEEAKVLNFYNWDTYIDPAILEDFEAQYGVTINYQVYDGEEEMLAELRAGDAEYDLVVPTDYTVPIMRREELLAPLNRANIPNFENIDPQFLDPVYDPGNRYCVPYQWGTTGIGYNIEATGREIKSLADFFDPEFAGRVVMYDEPRTGLGLTLLYLGHSPNTLNRAEITEAAEFLKSQASHIGAYVADSAQDLLVSGEADMVVEWSGDIVQLNLEDPKFRYVIPEEGSNIWTDAICIPATAPHKELAEQFINYLLEPEVGAALSNYIEYASPNAASVPLLDEEARTNPAIYPPAEAYDHLFYMVEIDPESEEFYIEAWEEILAEHGQ